MATEAEKRLHRCCFTGHRPEKLGCTEGAAKAALDKAIGQAIEDGLTVFITGMARGVDIWAGELVIARRRNDPNIKLICALPYAGFEAKWSAEWQARYRAILDAADLTKAICKGFSMGSYQIRNEWMVDHSARVIAFYNGASGGTKNTIEYAQRAGLSIMLVKE